jgi:hypothetical protein
MRVFLGMILGVLLTLGVAFVHDTWSTGPSTTTGSSSPTLVQRKMVNWDVVDENWQTLQRRAREGWNALAQKLG